MLWLAVGASFLFLVRLGKIFASKEGYWDDGRIPRCGNVVFFRGSTQLDWTMWVQADPVEVRFQTQKGTNCGTQR